MAPISHLKIMERDGEKLQAAAQLREIDQQNFSLFARAAAASREQMQDDIDRLKEDKCVVGNALLQ